MQPPIDVSLIILSWNTKDLLRACLDSLPRGLGRLRSEVIVIDNASHDGSADLVAREFPEVRLVRNAENRGYAPAVNQGLALGRGRHLCLLGSDTEAHERCFESLVAHLDAHPLVGAVAPRLENPDGSVQRACMRFPRLGTALWWDTPLQHFFPNARELRRYQMKEWDHRGSRAVDQPPGTCLMVRRAVLERVGPMDPRLWLFFNDVDWALRIRRAGYDIHYLDGPSLLHHLGGSTRHYADFGPEWHRNRIRYYSKHFHTAGRVTTKLALVWVALRYLWQVRRNVESWADWRPHAGGIVKSMLQMLVQER